MKLQIEILPAAFIGTAAGLLILPTEWFAAAIFAAAVHEGGHLLALYCLDIPRCCLQLRGTGAKIITGFLAPRQEFLCAAAGPLGSLSMLLLWHIFPCAALFGLFQGLFNFLPVYPLDGGRMLRDVLLQIIPLQTEFLEKAVSCLLFVVIIAISMGFRMPTIGILAVIFLLSKQFSEKYLANSRRNRYNISD